MILTVTSMSARCAGVTLTTCTGGMTQHYDATTLTGTGDWIEWTGQGASGTHWLLEIREIHQNRPAAFEYLVTVNGREVYARSYEETANAPCAYIIHLFPEKLGFSEGQELTVRISSLSSAPFSLEEAALFDASGEPQGGFAPMGLYVYNGSSEHPNGAADAVPRVEGELYYGEHYSYAYMDKNRAEERRVMESFAARARHRDVPLLLMPSRWWSCTTYSPDGLGGWFGDLQYGQLCYHQDTGGYELSIPNMWSSTYWGTMNHETVESVACIKLESSLCILGEALAHAAAASGRWPRVGYVMEWGDGYWTDRPLNGGDYSDAVVAAARADGIDLDPSDGLSPDEKRWMINNVRRYNERLAYAYHRALPNAPVLVGADGCVYPDRLPTDGLYSHTVQGTLYPSHDDRVAGWEADISPLYWPSSEMHEFSTRRYYDYQLTYGRVSCVNLETTMLNKDGFLRFLRLAYECGFEYVSLFNPDKKPTRDWLEAMELLAGQPSMEQETYARALYDVDFVRDWRPGLLDSLEGLAGFEGLAVGTDGLLRTSGDGGTLRLNLPGLLSPDGKPPVLALQVHTGGGSAEVLYPDGGGVYATAETGPGIDWFNPHTLWRVPLPDSASAPFRLGLRLTGDATIRAIRLEAPASRPSGHIGRQPTLGEKRLGSLWIQARAVAEHRLEQAEGIPADIRNEALRLCGQGCYRSADALLLRAMCEKIPALYAVSGGGVLGSYPIRVALPLASDTAVLTLLRYDADGCEIKIGVKRDMSVRLRLDGMSAGSTWSFENDTLSVTRTADHTGTPLDVAVSATAPTAAALTGTYEGRVLEADDNGLTLQLFDSDAGYWAEKELFPLAVDARFERRDAYGGDSTCNPPHRDDVAECVFDHGVIIACRARYGRDAGVIVDFDPPRLQGTRENGIITLDNGLQYRLSYQRDHTMLDVGGLSGAAKSVPIDRITEVLRSGLRVQLCFLPLNESIPRLLVLQEDTR